MKRTVKKGFTKVTITPEIFRRARMLFDAGLNEQQVMTVLGISISTVNRIHHCTSWAEYEELKKRHAAKKELTPIEKEDKQDAKDIANQAVNTPVEKMLDKVLNQNHVLLAEVKELRDAVQWIADNAVVKVVEQNPTKRKRFF